jgi:hypothetical protein
MAKIKEIHRTVLVLKVRTAIWNCLEMGKYRIPIFCVTERRNIAKIKDCARKHL